MEHSYHIHDNNHYNKPYINRVGIDVPYQQMKTDEIAVPYYFIKQKRPTTTQEKQERGK